MLLTITTTYQPATDLGYLLHKNPARAQSFALSFGAAHIFYPEASDERCTAALLLEVDPIQLVRRKDESLSLEQYVNDRPYVASSFLSVALAETLGTALNGRCTQKPELAATPLPLQATLSVVKCRGGEALLRRLFEPLGYTVTVMPHALDEHYPVAAGKLTVIDATNVQPEDRKPLIVLAREYHALLVAIIFNLPEQICHERNRQRPDRDFGPHVVRRQIAQMRRSFAGLRHEGTRCVACMNAFSAYWRWKANRSIPASDWLFLPGYAIVEAEQIAVGIVQENRA